MTGADALVAALREGGVEVVFGLPGVHNMAAWRALEASPIRLVAVRHEQAAAYAADGYARATGRPGVALVTTGPGAANTLGGLGEAHASRSPVVLIATDVPSGVRRPGVVRGALHEGADQAAMFAPVVKASHVVTPSPPTGSVGAAVAAALREAVAPPARPVYVEVPTDRLAVPDASPETSATPTVARVSGRDGPAALPEVLRTARRPLVWAGGGALHARDEVRALARALGAPVLDTFTGRGLGTVGLPPHVPEAGDLWDAADVVVAVGSDLDGMSTQDWRQPAPPVLVAVNVDLADAAKNYVPDVLVEADATAVGAWAGQLGAPRPPWADVGDLRSRALARLRAEHPEELAFLDAVAGALPEDAVLLCDMCIPGYWLSGLHPVPAPRRLQYPMGWGTLGFAFPASLGAACAGAGPVVSVSGDGGFLFACGELATAAQHALPLTAVVVDDGAWGMLGVELPGPDFVALARSFGVRAEGVDGVGPTFADALARHVADPAPSVLVARARLVPPPTTSPHWYRRGA